MVRIGYFRDRSNLHQYIEQELRYLHTDDIKVARIKYDNELLFSAIYKKLYRKQSIEILLTALYNPSQNRIAERLNRTLFQLVRVILIDAGLPQTLWGEAIYYVIYIINLMPKKDKKSLYKKQYGNKPEAIYLKPFGCLCYLYNISPALKKLDNKIIKYRFLAHEEKLIFRVWNIKKKRVLRSAHIVFDKKYQQLLTRMYSCPSKIRIRMNIACIICQPIRWLTWIFLRESLRILRELVRSSTNLLVTTINNDHLVVMTQVAYQSSQAVGIAARTIFNQLTKLSPPVNQKLGLMTSKLQILYLTKSKIQPIVELQAK